MNNNNVELLIPKRDLNFRCLLPQLVGDVDLADLVMRCLVLDPRSRITCEQGLQHKFVTKIFD